MISGDAETLETIAYGARDVGFLTLENTPISGEAVQELIALYRRFFKMDDAAKAAVDMARTGANRGWGASKSEQVDPEVKP